MALDKWKEVKQNGYWTVKRARHTKKRPKILKGTIKAIQYAIKRTKNTYDLTMKGTKTKQR